MQQNTTQFTHPGVDNIHRYITFWIDNRLYGIQSTEDWEVISGKTVSPVRDLPEFVSGVIIWRTRVVPVLDLRSCLTPEKPASMRPASILVMRSFKTGSLLEAGISIDQVNMETVLNPGEILGNPENLNNGFIGTSQLGNSQVALLDIKALLLNRWHTG